jgi:hypothetical protein
LKTILNKTKKPLRVQLRGGKVLHLGPGKTGQISDDASGDASIKRMTKAKEIEVLGDEDASQGGSEAATIHEAPRGHHPKTMVLPKGNR